MPALRPFALASAALALTTALSGCDGRVGRAFDELVTASPEMPAPLDPMISRPVVIPPQTPVEAGNPTYGLGGQAQNERVYARVYEQPEPVRTVGAATPAPRTAYEDDGVLTERPLAAPSGTGYETDLLASPIYIAPPNARPPAQNAGAVTYRPAQAPANTPLPSPSPEAAPRQRYATAQPSTAAPTPQPRYAAAQPRPEPVLQSTNPYLSPEPRMKPVRKTAAARPAPTPEPTLAPVQPSPAGDFPGGSWTLAELSGSRTEGGVELHFDAASGFAGGRAQCNDYGGEFNAAGGAFSMRNIFATERSCDGIDAEQRYIRALEKATVYELAAGGRALTLKDAGGAALARFEPF